MPSSKENKNEIYRDFLEKNLELRTKEEKKVFEQQVNFLKENHQARLDYYEQLHKLKIHLKFGDQDNNNKVRTEIKKLREQFATTSKARRDSFFRNSLQKEISNFQQLMNQQKNQLKAKLQGSAAETQDI